MEMPMQTNRQNTNCSCSCFRQNVNTPTSSLTLLLQPPQPPMPHSFLFLLIATVFMAASATASSDDATFPNCSQTFNCGTIRSITYPFTGADRPSHCGPPEFRLNCVEDSTYLSSTTSSLIFKVLQLDQTRRALTIARTDLYNNTCKQNNYLNTTLNTTIFDYDATNENLTIFYKCSTLLTLKPQNMFTCDINGSESTAYYLFGTVPSDPILNVSKCNVSVSVPISRLATDMLEKNRSLLREALMEGFEVNYADIYDEQCGKCIGIGGRCGFDPVLGEPICICGDEICSITGPVHKKSFITTFAVGGAALLLGIITTILTILFCRSRKLSTYEDNINIEEAVINTYGYLAPKRYKYFELKKITNSFTEKIGQGGYGTVYKGKLPDGRLVAVKLLFESKGHGEEFVNEVASISRTAHVNVVSLLGYCYERKRRALIYEFMPNGSLDKFIPTEGALHTSSKIDWKILHQIAIGIARGLEYLHRGCNSRILHFDIKPQNILLGEDFVPKISDFGLAKLCLEKESIVSLLGIRGTVGYIAPEVFSRNFGRVSHKSDIYSYGMLVLAMVCGKSINNDQVSRSSDLYFPQCVYKQLEPSRDFKFQGIVTAEEEEIGRKLILVSFWCIQTNPSNRPSISKVTDMLEGSLHLVEMPPEPFLFDPANQRATASPLSSSDGDGENEESSSMVDGEIMATGDL